MKRTILLILPLLTMCLGCHARTGRSACEVINSDSILRVMVEEGGYDFINLAADTIIDYGQHIDFTQLREGLTQGQTYNVVHYGDSHLQAGTIGQVVRLGLQNRFGDAGPGFVTPYRLADAGYEPLWYRIYSDRAWNGCRIVSRNAVFDAGASGLAIRYADPAATRQDLTVETLNRTLCERLPVAVDNRFSVVKVFHDSLAPLISVADQHALLHEIGQVESCEQSEARYTTAIYLKEPMSELRIATYADGCFSGGRGGISGMSLENGMPGVLYHSLGISSACAVHWSRSEQVIRQGQCLDPDLTIVSLGSNEAAGTNFSEDVFYKQIDALVQRVMEVTPDASILLTTPAQVFRKTRSGAVPNDNYAQVAATIHQYARDHQLSVFDLWAATSGNEGAANWLKYDLIRKDKLHFTQQGYELQGLLLLGALVRQIEQG